MNKYVKHICHVSRLLYDIWPSIFYYKMCVSVCARRSLHVCVGVCRLYVYNY